MIVMIVLPAFFVDFRGVRCGWEYGVLLSDKLNILRNIGGVRKIIAIFDG